MSNWKIFRFICSIILTLLTATTLTAQQPQKRNGDSNKNVQKTDSLQKAIIDAALSQEKAPLIAGIAVSGDLVGLSMKALGSRFANMEVAGRLNFREKYFPIVELGIGDCTREGGENANEFSVTSPYYRIGMDYNMNKKFNGNRFFCGLRYAFCKYEYDFKDPEFYDPVWNTTQPLYLKDMDGKNQWLEIVLGVETKLWSIVRLGWNIRFKTRLKESVSDYGKPWYVPGYGKNGSTSWGGTVNLTFDVGKTARKNAGQKKINLK